MTNAPTMEKRIAAEERGDWGGCDDGGTSHTACLTCDEDRIKSQLGGDDVWGTEAEGPNGGVLDRTRNGERHDRFGHHDDNNKEKKWEDHWKELGKEESRKVRCDGKQKVGGKGKVVLGEPQLVSTFYDKMRA
jgi:hypothetical protein